MIRTICRLLIEQMLPLRYKDVRSVVQSQSQCCGWMVRRLKLRDFSVRAAGGITCYQPPLTVKELGNRTSLRYILSMEI